MAKDKTGTPEATTETNLVTPGTKAADVKATAPKADDEASTDAPGPKTMTTASVSGISGNPEGKAAAPAAPADPAKPSTKTVEVKINYPKGYEGPRFYKDGDVTEVSEPSAEIFVAAGIGTIVKKK